MATSGSIKSSSCATTLAYYGARWEFRWTAKPSDSEPGVTIVSYSLYTIGRSSSPTQAVTEIKLTVYDHDDKVIESYASTRETRSFKDVLQYSGSFEVHHKTDGSASFKVSMSTDIYEGVFRPASGTGTLDVNKPYHCVEIDTGTGRVKIAFFVDTDAEWDHIRFDIEDGSAWEPIK
jgi:hypothetical protein